MKIRELIEQLHKYEQEKEIYVVEEPVNTLDGLPTLRPVKSCEVIGQHELAPANYEVEGSAVLFSVIRVVDQKPKAVVKIPDSKVQEMIVSLADRLKGDSRKLFLSQVFGLDESEKSEQTINTIFKSLRGEEQASNSEQDQFVIHEALDRTYQILDQLQRALSENGFVQRDIEVRALYEQSVEKVADLYQLIGARSCEKTHSVTLAVVK